MIESEQGLTIILSYVLLNHVGAHFELVIFAVY